MSPVLFEMIYLRSMKTFSLNGSPYIQLNQLLKATGTVYSGGEAKTKIQHGQVIVNDKVEERLRCKLVIGDIVTIDEHVIKIEA